MAAMIIAANDRGNDHGKSGRLEWFTTPTTATTGTTVANDHRNDNDRYRSKLEQTTTRTRNNDWNHYRSDWNRHPNYWDNRSHDRADYGALSLPLRPTTARRVATYQRSWLPRKLPALWLVLEPPTWSMTGGPVPPLTRPPYGYSWVRVGR